MKELQLSQGLFAQVDDEDFETASAFKWTALKQKRTYYAYRMVKRDGKQKAIYLHRWLMKTPRDMVTDHRDGNGLNCQRSNLRICTKTQNAQNIQKIRKSTTSKYKGVFAYTKTVTQIRRYFQVSIQAEGKEYSLGIFRDEIAAAKAYNAAAIKYHGEFASLNAVP